jgi:hypothetical protein
MMILTRYHPTGGGAGNATHAETRHHPNEFSGKNVNEQNPTKGSVFSFHFQQKT